MIRQEFFDKNIIYGVPAVWAWRFGVDKYSTIKNSTRLYTV